MQNLSMMINPQPRMKYQTTIRFRINSFFILRLATVLISLIPLMLPVASAFICGDISCNYGGVMYSYGQGGGSGSPIVRT